MSLVCGSFLCVCRCVDTFGFSKSHNHTVDLRSVSLSVANARTSSSQPPPSRHYFRTRPFSLFIFSVDRIARIVPFLTPPTYLIRRRDAPQRTIRARRRRSPPNRTHRHHTDSSRSVVVIVGITGCSITWTHCCSDSIRVRSRRHLRICRDARLCRCPRVAGVVVRVEQQQQQPEQSPQQSPTTATPSAHNTATAHQPLQRSVAFRQ